MKSAFLSAILMLSMGYLNAQNETLLLAEKPAQKGKFALDLSAGASLVSGNFTKTDYTDSTAGFAQSTGLNLQLRASYNLRQNLPVYVSISSAQYGMNDLKNLAEGYLTDFDVDSTTLTAKGRYQHTALLVGTGWLGEFVNIRIDAHMMAGVSMLKTPEMRVDLEDNAAATFYQRSSSGMGFAWQIGAGASYDFTSKWGMRIGVEYMSAKPNVSIENENRTSNTGRLISTYHQPINSMTARLGIVYQLN
jgi:opacity protein-like surface antigen